MASRLLDRRGIDLSELALGRPQAALESDAAVLLREAGGALAEQLVCEELLVDLEADLQAEGPVVHRLGKTGGLE